MNFPRLAPIKTERPILSLKEENQSQQLEREDQVYLEGKFKQANDEFRAGTPKRTPLKDDA